MRRVGMRGLRSLTAVVIYSISLVKFRFIQIRSFACDTIPCLRTVHRRNVRCSYSRPQNKVIRHMRLTQYKGSTVLCFDVAL